MKGRIIETIQRCYQEEGKISIRIYEKKDYAIANSTIRRYFKSWADALKASNIPSSSPKMSPQNIIRALQKCFEEEGKIQRDVFIKKPYGCSAGRINTVFGSWSNALFEAGLKKDPTKRIVDPKMEEKILNEIKMFIMEKGDERTDFKSFRSGGYSFSHQTIKKYFGSWNQAYDVAKYGCSLYSKNDLIHSFGLPHNFAKGIQYIPALKDKLINVGSNSKSNAIYKIRKEDVDYLINYYNEQKQKHDEYSKQKGWFTRYECLNAIYFDDSILKDMITNGILVNGEDYVYLDRINWRHLEKPTSAEAKILFIHQNSFVKFQIATLGTLLKAFSKSGIKTSFETLAKLRDQGALLKEIETGSNQGNIEYFNKDSVLHVLTKYLNNRIRGGMAPHLSSYDYLNEHQQELIDKFISAREAGAVIQWNGYTSKRYIAHKDLRLPEIKNRLANAFFSIICGRCGIDYSNGVIDLNDKDLESFDPNIFQITDVTMDDYQYISRNRKTATLVIRFFDLRTFYYWHLMRKDMEPKNSFEDYQAFDTLRKNIETFLSQFPKNMKDAPIQEKRSQLNKVFLSREELILCRNAILKDIRSRNPLRNAAIWMLCSLTGIRPEELLHLRIEHFLLDENGLLKLNDKNYGELNIDRTVGKGEYSTSHPIFKTPIPITAVEQINMYLNDLYRRQGSQNPIGEGYFLRSHDLAANSPLRVLEKPFIERLRGIADFLPQGKRKNLILKNTRHSLNTIMTKSYIHDHHLRENVQSLAIQHQMRHKPINQTMGEKHYLEDISRDDYYAILDKTINFPWNIEKLKTWELTNGYQTLNDEENQSPTEKKTAELAIDEKTRETLFIELERINDQLNKIKTRDKNTTTSDWLKARKELSKRKNQLEFKLFL